MPQIFGEAFVEIRPELTKFAGELKEGVTGAVDKTEAESTGAFNKLAGVGRAAFLGIAAAAVGFGVAAIDAALKGQEATAQLAQAVKNTGGNWDELEPSVSKVTESYAKFGYANDQVEGALSRLIQTTGNTSESLGLLQTAANLAAARHMDLTAAAQLVGRAADGNVTVLKRYGIQVTATGDKAKDGANAIALLNERFGGAAQAQADTYAGKLKAFRAETENLTEKVGNALLPILADLAGDLSTAVDFFEHNRTAALLLAAAVGGPLVVAMGAYIVTEGIAVATKLADFFTTTAIQALYAKDAILKAVVSLQTFTAEVLSTEAATQSVAASVTGVGLAVGVLTVGVVLAGKALSDYATNATQKFRDAGDAFASSFLKEVGNAPNRLQLIRAEVTQLTQAQYVHGTQTYKDAEALKVLTAELKNSAASAGGAKDAQGALADAQESAGVTAGDLATKYGMTEASVSKLAASMKIDLAKATEDQLAQLDEQANRLHVSSARTLTLSDAIAKLSDETADATAKTSAFKTALDILIGGNIDAEKAVVAFQDKIDGLSTKLTANKLSFDAATKAGRDNITAVEDSVTAIRTHIEALQNQGAGADALQGALAGDTDALRKQLIQAGLTGAQIDALLGKYNLTQGALGQLLISYDSVANSVQRFNDLNSAFHAPQFPAPGGNAGGVRRAAKGGFWDGNHPELAVVGDSREVMLPLDDPRRIAEILTEAGMGSGRSRAAAAAGGGVTIGAGAVNVRIDAAGLNAEEVAALAGEKVVEALEVFVDRHQALQPA